MMVESVRGLNSMSYPTLEGYHKIEEKPAPKGWITEVGSTCSDEYITTLRNIQRVFPRACISEEMEAYSKMWDEHSRKDIVDIIEFDSFIKVNSNY